MIKVLPVVIVILVIIAAGGFLLYGSSPKQTAQPTSGTPAEINATLPPVAEDVTELKIEDIVIGTGASATTGKKITVNYKGVLTNGTQFDSSYDRGQPFSFVLGAGNVIQGWEKGFEGMKVGGKRKLTIPANLGYGANANGQIPANSTLIFEVELLKVE